MLPGVTQPEPLSAILFLRLSLSLERSTPDRSFRTPCAVPCGNCEDWPLSGAMRCRFMLPGAVGTRNRFAAYRYLAPGRRRISRRQSGRGCSAQRLWGNRDPRPRSASPRAVRSFWPPPQRPVCCAARHCSLSMRNQRLAVIHGLARFIAERSPEHIEWSGQIRAIPFKNGPKRSI
jgi:hypothetical protein